MVSHAATKTAELPPEGILLCYRSARRAVNDHQPIAAALNCKRQGAHRVSNNLDARLHCLIKLAVRNILRDTTGFVREADMVQSHKDIRICS